MNFLTQERFLQSVKIIINAGFDIGNYNYEKYQPLLEVLAEYQILTVNFINGLNDEYVSNDQKQALSEILHRSDNIKGDCEGDVADNDPLIPS